MFLIKNKDFTYSPVDDSDRNESNKVAVGTVVAAKAPRNYKFHKKAFALLNMGFENQEKFASFEIYRKVQTILAGFYDEVTQPDGKVMFLPHSLSFESMSAETFNKWYIATLDVLAAQMEVQSETIKAQIDKFY